MATFVKAFSGIIITSSLLANVTTGFAQTKKAPAKTAASKPYKLKYPTTKKGAESDEYYGEKVADPYRWLENDKSPETAKWVTQQNEVTFGYLNRIPFREAVKNRLTELWNFEKKSAPFKKGNYYFFYKNDGIQNQSVLYVQEGLNMQPRVLLDPNTLSADGTVALSEVDISKDAKYLAYSISRAGSDWNEIYVLNIASGKPLTDKIEWVKFSNIAWKGNGFYYSRYDAPKAGASALSNKNEFHKIYYHTIGETADKDKLIYQDKSFPLRNYSAGVTEDEETLIISGSEGTSGNSLMVKDLKDPKGYIKTIVDNFTDDYTVIDKVDGELLVLTNHDAPNYKLVRVNLDKYEPGEWKKVIPETKDLLESVSRASDKLIVKYLKDATSRLYIHSLDGTKEKEIELPGIGKVDAVNGNREDSLIFYSFVTFTAPASVYKYNLNTNSQIQYFKPDINFKSSYYKTEQVFFTSKDGTKVPMFITYKNGMNLNGLNPCFLYGYGGFNISVTPSFNIDRALFLEQGGILAVVNLRGGGEYGETWHQDGTKLNKQNVFDDFIAAAEYLIKQKYTSSEKLAIHGRSNGGLLIGAVMTQRPDLAKVAIPGVGVLDMLRYHKFTIGWAWKGDYGTSDESEEMFKYLYKYSPVHNVKAVEYPATMIFTADHDDRVVPAHSFKFISQLQAHQKGTEPVLIRVDVNAGHGAGKPTSKQIEEFADIWSFIFYNLGMAPSY